MRTRLSFYVGLPFLLGAALVLAAQTDHVTPFTGTWKMNLTKSRFHPGPPFKSFTLVFAPDGTRHLDLIGADGRATKAALPWSDGNEVPVTGMENTTATSKIQGKTFHDIWKRNGAVIEDVRGVVSSNGKTLTITVHAADQQGRPYRNRISFEKQ